MSKNPGLTATLKLSDGTSVFLRPIRPSDSEQAAAFREKLSAQSIYERFLGYVPKITPKLIKRLTEIDLSREIAIVAEVDHKGQREGIAIARLVKEKADAGEFAIIIADVWQGKGLGNLMTDYMIQIAGKIGYGKLIAYVFAENGVMLHILKQKGFELKREDGATILAEMILGD